MIPLHAAPCIDRMPISSIEADSHRVKYSNLFLPNIRKIPRAMHQIKLKPNAVACSLSQPRPVPLAKRHAVSEVLKRMVEDDLIESISCSQWVHPLVAVQKKGGPIWVCTDLRMLNQHVIVDKFPLPSTDTLITKVAGAKVFSKLEIRSAYFHMPATSNLRHLTAFLTDDGLF